MDKARLYQHGRVGERVFARGIDDEPWWRQQKIPLICPFCMTPVVSQRTSVGRAPRSALFRLAADQRHEDTCPLNPTEVLEKIARGSQGVAVIDGDELHLVLPDDLDQLSVATPPFDGDAPAPVDTLGVNISTVRPLLPPLINSAVVIARFLQKHRYDADVVAQFKVRRPGEKQAVSWGEFCHGPTPDDHTRLYARVTGGHRPPHPVAVYGRVTTINTDSSERPVVRLADGRGHTVRIRSEHPSLLAPLTVGTYVLAVGNWKVWTPRKGSRRPELQMFAEEHWQLAHWTYDDTTGESSPPRCPPPLSLAQHTLRQTRTAPATRPAPPRRPARPSPTPRPFQPPTPFTPPPASPPTAPKATVPPAPAPPHTPAADPAPTEPAPPTYPPVPPRPPAPPRRIRRGWWPFSRQR